MELLEDFEKPAYPSSLGSSGTDRKKTSSLDFKVSIEHLPVRLKFLMSFGSQLNRRVHTKINELFPEGELIIRKKM